jgi:hypothetical protein
MTGMELFLRIRSPGLRTQLLVRPPPVMAQPAAGTPPSGVVGMRHEAAPGHPMDIRPCSGKPFSQMNEASAAGDGDGHSSELRDEPTCCFG